MIPVNKPFLPDISRYKKHIDQIFSNVWLTNNGPMVRELKFRLEDYLGVKHLLPVANGTLALQLAYKALDVKGEAVTTPFTFVATASSLKWENIQPVFADIDPLDFNLCPDKAAKVITPETTAIVPVHVFGNACDVAGIGTLAEHHNLKVIYDAAHAFGIQYKGESILNYGDAATLSFHATKVFHSIEGGAVIFKDEEAYERAFKMINFGIDTSNSQIVDQGINAKMSEMHAAMGLAVLDNIDWVLERRRVLYDRYISNLRNYVVFPQWRENANQNGAYMPVIFQSASKCDKVFSALKENGIMARRYFSPSLSQVETFGPDKNVTPKANDLVTRILCLPLYYDLAGSDLEYICSVVKKSI